MLFVSHLIPTSFLVLSALCLCAKANYVVIECKFPCANDGDVCQVSNAYVQCKPRTNSTKWVLKDTMSLPEYQGPLIQLGQTCITAPQPSLRDASHLSKNSTETCLEWPPEKAYDVYYSNCANDFYCDRAHICVKQLTHGEVCESDNQCLNGSCIGHTCAGKEKEPSSSGSNTVHIIASTIGVALFLGVVFCIYFFRRRQIIKKKAAKQQEIDQERPAVAVLPKTAPSSAAIKSNSPSSADTATHSRTSSTTLNNNNNNNNNNYPSINMLHPTYDLHFQQESLNSSRTPSMQQQQLQHELQRQILFNKTNHNTTTQGIPGTSSSSLPVTPQTPSPPPPPYSP